MPLVSCPDCGDQVSTLALACPHCGRPMATPLEAAAKSNRSFDEEYDIEGKTKTCPYCSQEIEADSTACRWCLRDLTTEEAARKGYKWTAGRAGWAIAAMIILAIYVISLATDRPAPQQTQSASGHDRAAFAPVEADRLAAAYDTNEIAADQRFKGKHLAISGTVENIGKDVLNTMFVTLAGPPNSFRNVQCFFGDEQGSQLARLSPGQSITVSGRCDGLFGNVLVRDCRLMK